MNLTLLGMPLTRVLLQCACPIPAEFPAARPYLICSPSGPVIQHPIHICIIPLLQLLLQAAVPVGDPGPAALMLKRPQSLAALASGMLTAY